MVGDRKRRQAECRESVVMGGRGSGTCTSVAMGTGVTSNHGVRMPELGGTWTFPGACGEGMARDSAAAEHAEQLFRTCSAAPALPFLHSAGRWLGPNQDGWLTETRAHQLVSFMDTTSPCVPACFVVGDPAARLGRAPEWYLSKISVAADPPISNYHGSSWSPSLSRRKGLDRSFAFMLRCHGSIVALVRPRRRKVPRF